jgi:hypothetical protein
VLIFFLGKRKKTGQRYEEFSIKGAAHANFFFATKKEYSTDEREILKQVQDDNGET